MILAILLLLSGIAAHAVITDIEGREKNMKKVTVIVPDSVSVISATYIGTARFNTWVLTSAFKPEDGLEVFIEEIDSKDKAATATYRRAGDGT